jgi:hypothetical protein
MYYLAKLHPDLRETWQRTYRGGYLTRAQKEEAILDFYREKQCIPLCIDHCNADKAGFVVPEGERIGRVVDLFNNEKGEMMVKLCLDQKHRSFRTIERGIWVLKEKWGVSMWVDWNTQTGKKYLTHVALTKDPMFASHNTFLGTHGLFEDAVDRSIARHYYKEKRGLCFAAPEFRSKLRGMTKKSKTSPLFDPPLTTVGAFQDPRWKRKQQRAMASPQDEQFEGVDGGEEFEEEVVGEMQTEVSEAPKDTKRRAVEEAPVAKAPLKRRKATTPRADLPAMKDLEQINMTDFLDLKSQYDVYDEYVNNSGLRWSELDPLKKKAFLKLEEQLNETKKAAQDWVNVLEKDAGFPNKIAQRYRCGFADNSLKPEVQENQLAFVACSSRYLELNTAPLRQENETLRKEKAALEEQLASSSRPAQAPAQRPRVTPPSLGQQKQAVQQAAAAAATQKQTVNILGLDNNTNARASKALPPQYERFVAEGGGLPRPNSYELSKENAEVANVFEDFFNRS